MAGILLFIWMQTPGICGTTGKITGQVTDTQGNPLPGVAVLIEGTKRGNETDTEGIYFLLSIEPGRHTLVASMVGFEKQRKEGVLVSSDFTTSTSFQLKELPIQQAEIVVEAQRSAGNWSMFSVKANMPAVEPDRTTTKYIIRAGGIEALPIVRSMDDLIELQAGVTVDEEGEELTIRAGDAENVAYYLDGVPIPSTDHVRARVYRDFNRLAVQEMTVVTGGMDAEYGNAQGGVVSVVTRDGGHQVQGMLDYQITLPGKKHWGQNVYDSNIHRGHNRWDDPEWASETVTLPDSQETLAHQRLDYTEVWGHFLEGYLSNRRKKQHWSPWFVSRKFVQYRRELGLDDAVVLHSLRHSFTTHLREAGGREEDVQDLLQHVSRDTTGIYDHTETSLVGHQALVDKLDLTSPEA